MFEMKGSDPGRYSLNRFTVDIRQMAVTLRHNTVARAAPSTGTCAGSVCLVHQGTLQLRAAYLNSLFRGKVGVRMVPGCGERWKSRLAISSAVLYPVALWMDVGVPLSDKCMHACGWRG